MVVSNSTRPCAKYSGHLTEGQCKYRLFCQPRVKNWAGLVDPIYMKSVASRFPRRMAKVQEHIEFPWDEMPTSELLDLMFGIDAPVNYSGSLLAIDMTIRSDHQGLVNKRRVLERLEEHAPIEGVTAAAVWVINPNSPPTGEEMIEVVKSMRGQRNFCQVYYL